ncbi:MAG TPA: LOG family protein [Candidatus Acidoferrales bacterium]|nr:LOG family protein [Candidatus Acidoferrales bacterium]
MNAAGENRKPQPRRKEDPRKIITVFGSSRPREGDSHYALAHNLGAALAAQGFTVCSGGYGGVMEAVSRGAKEAGGRTLAVTAEFFRARANRWVDEEVRVVTWQERLFELVRRGSGYVACPGGTGTLVELAVVWEMINKRVMRDKPFVALGEFWQPIIDRVREVEIAHASNWGESTERLIHVAHEPAHAAAYLASKLTRSVKTAS